MNDEAQQLRLIYRWSFAIRFGVALTAWYIAQFLNLSLVEDAGRYQEFGAIIADDWRSGNSSTLLEEWREGGQAWGMLAFIAVFYLLTGGVATIPILLAFYSAITAFAPVLTYRIARKLGASPAGARTGAWIVVFCPGFAIWSALYKEGVIFVILNLITYQVLLLQEKFQWRSLLIIGVCLPALFALRFYLAIMIAPVIVLSMLLGRSKQEARGNTSATELVLVRQVLIVAVIVVLLASVGFTDQVQKFLPTDVGNFFSQMQNVRDDLANSANSGFLRGADVSTPEAALKFLPVALAYFLAVPLPWEMGELRQNIAIPETLFWLVMYRFVLAGMSKGLRHNFPGSTLIIAMTVLISCFYAVFMGNIGTVYRMRTQVWLLWAVFAGWGWEERRVKKPLKS
ncbi:MAG TPA: hypothetical protein V6D12_11575 [Candidatus Obscuribacterales bacterium]